VHEFFDALWDCVYLGRREVLHVHLSLPCPLLLTRNVATALSMEYTKMRQQLRQGRSRSGPTDRQREREEALNAKQLVRERIWERIRRHRENMKARAVQVPPDGPFTFKDIKWEY
jgi:hypothetical protein